MPGTEQIMERSPGTACLFTLRGHTQVVRHCFDQTRFLGVYLHVYTWRVSAVNLWIARVQASTSQGFLLNSLSRMNSEGPERSDWNQSDREMVKVLRKQLWAVYSDTDVVSQGNKNLFRSFLFFFLQGLNGAWQGDSRAKALITPPPHGPELLMTILPPKKAHASMFQIPTEIYPLTCKWVWEWPTYLRLPYFIPESVNAINGTLFTRKRIACR